MERKTFFILVPATKQGDKIDLNHFKGRENVLFSFVSWESQYLALFPVI